MILTGSSISEAVESGDIFLQPFDRSMVNPNSYNYRLGSTLRCFEGYEGDKSLFKTIVIPDEGYVLDPHQMYLGNTLEVIGSKKYAMSLIGRSSLGRLGLFLQISANLGHTTSCHQWTLEIVAVHPIRLYAGMKIGQVSFWNNCGHLIPSEFTYATYNEPQQSVYSWRHHDSNRL